MIANIYGMESVVGYCTCKLYIVDSKYTQVVLGDQTSRKKTSRLCPMLTKRVFRLIIELRIPYRMRPKKVDIWVSIIIKIMSYFMNH